MNRISKLTPEEAIHWMKTSDGTRIIEIYASWCIYHMLTIRKLELLQPHLPEDVQFGSVDVVGHEAAFLAEGIDQVPTIVFQQAEHQLRWVGDTDLEIILSAIRGVPSMETAR